jgi:hypothetical protein
MFFPCICFVTGLGVVNKGTPFASPALTHRILDDCNDFSTIEVDMELQHHLCSLAAERAYNEFVALHGEPVHDKPITAYFGSESSAVQNLQCMTHSGRSLTMMRACC